MEVVLNRKLNNRIQVYKNNKSIFNPIDLNELKKLKVNKLNFTFTYKMLLIKCCFIIIRASVLTFILGNVVELFLFNKKILIFLVFLC